ncbi:hypothetical protein RhiirA1_477588 [Rhizophagus irregularis]|uniref:Uncharacterized protein n=1 Tax=Rhizophagus irregularis TaxID=588596 RepID=A0A2I1FIG5_9GLOM|nr:hypothetical protein RhiirA1_477588 [Rhizophagus irregularis]PKY34174.1 hypothetical protein RhiirB3_453637 [Rhizophagus irregularis]
MSIHKPQFKSKKGKIHDYLKSITANIKSEQHLNLNNLDEQNKKTDFSANRNDELNHMKTNNKDVIDIEGQF